MALLLSSPLSQLGGLKMRRIVVLVSCAGAALAGLGIQSSSADPVAATRTQGPVLAAGQVVAHVDEASGPVEGAEVLVWWLPTQGSVDAGDAIAMESVGTATTDANGEYSLRMEPTQSMETAAAANGGWVNFSIGTISDQIGKSSTTNISRRLVDGRWVARSVGRPALRRGSNGAEDPMVPESLWSQTDFTLTESSPNAPRASSRLARRSPIYCQFKVTATPQRSVKIFEFHNASNSEATWKYGHKSDSDIDVAVDISGNGGWSAGGSSHVSNTNTVKVFRTYNERVNHFARTDFKFWDGYWDVTWGDPNPYPGQYCEGTSIRWGTKEKKAITWEGGVGSSTGEESAYIGCDQAPQSDHRTSYPVGSGLTRDSSNAAKIGLAADVGPIKVGAKSGYAETVSLSWTAKRGHGIWLCGTNYGVSQAGVVHAQNRP